MVKFLQQYKIFPAESYHTFDQETEQKLISDGIAINWEEKPSKGLKIKHQDSQAPKSRGTARATDIKESKKSNQ